jgi:hypothetical protein
MWALGGPPMLQAVVKDVYPDDGARCRRLSPWAIWWLGKALAFLDDRVIIIETGARERTQ